MSNKMSSKDISTFDMHMFLELKTSERHSLREVDVFIWDPSDNTLTNINLLLAKHSMTLLHHTHLYLLPFCPFAAYWLDTSKVL